jgi:type IV secretory pathway VirB4 component
MGGVTQFARALISEVEATSFIPYSSHVTENTIKLVNGDFLQIIKLQGAAHESADIEDINNWHHQLNGMMRNIASPKVALWSHVVRREFNEYPEGEFPSGFCHDFNEKYRTQIASGRMLVNELYLSIIYRPQTLKVGSWLEKFNVKSIEELEEEQTDMRVLQSSNRASEEQAAVAKYGALKTAFTTRDAIMTRAGGVSHPQVVADGADKHIVDAILSGHIATLNNAAQQIPEHQAVEQQHELQG